MVYKNGGKEYQVENVVYGGACINVNGKTITDTSKYNNGMKDFMVFHNGEEYTFGTFEKAYEFAMGVDKEERYIEL